VQITKARGFIVQYMKSIRVLVQGIIITLTLSFTFVAGGTEQTIRARPAPAAVQPMLSTRPSTVSPQPAVGAQGAQPMSSQTPDVYIQEAILSYPGINAEFHIVFPNQPGRSAIPLNLYPTTDVPVVQGHTTDSERRFPVLGCDRPLTANLRVIISNSGKKAYDGMPLQAGVTATVAGAQFSGGFASISSQQSQSVNLGPLTMKPGTYAFGIVVNQGKTGGELNFSNNVARGSFEIRCQGASGPTFGVTPAGTARALTTGELTMTGQRAELRVIATGELTMTGQRADTRIVNTGELTMTGQRVDSRAVTPGELIMTGQRAETRGVTTGEVTLTGRR